MVVGKSFQSNFSVDVVEKLKNNCVWVIIDNVVVGGYGVVVVCCYIFEVVIVIVCVVEVRKLLVLIQLFLWVIEYVDGLFFYVVVEVVDKVLVFVGVYMDYVQDFDMI